MSLSCGSVAYRILVILIVCADIGVGWYAFYEMYKEVDGHPVCSSEDGYWKAYAVCQGLATVFDVLQIIELIIEIRRGKRLGPIVPFIIVFVSYLAVIGASVSNIAYLSQCKCSGVSFSNWTAGKVEFIRGVTSGTSRVVIQLLIHASEILFKCCRMRQIVKEKDKTHGAVKVINGIVFALFILTFLVELFYLFCKEN